MLESIDLSCTLNGFLPMQDYRASCIGLQEKTEKLLSYADLPNVDTFHKTVPKNFMC